jgi:hypothetical protein
VRAGREREGGKVGEREKEVEREMGREGRREMVIGMKRERGREHFNQHIWLHVCYG